MILSCAVTSQTEIDIIRKVRPIRTLLLSHTHDDEAVVAALSAGVGGYMTDGSYSGSLISINQINFRIYSPAEPGASRHRHGS